MPEKNSVGAAGAAATACVDRDGDGFGENCPAGRDCSDSDPTNTTQCFGACSRPSEGCECNNDAPVSCFLDETANADGTTMCHEGTRLCHNGVWGACGNVHSYSVKPRQDTRLLPDVVRRATCSDCELNCFVAADPLTYVDGGLGGYADPDIEQIPAGGITIAQSLDGGVVYPDAGPDQYRDAAFDAWPPNIVGACLVGGITDPLDFDCDNVPDNYDSNPFDPNQPFNSLHEPIVLTTPSTANVDVLIDDFVFRLPAADVYFMLDVTRNQNVERQEFIDAINDVGTTSVTDSLVDDIAGFAYNCVDVDGDGNSVNENALYKAAGVLGAARCFTGDTEFGVGFLDEVPVKDSCLLSYGGFLGWGATTWTECHYGEYTSGSGTVPFRNLLDLNPSDAVLRSAVWRLPQIATRLEIPQAGSQALWAISAGGAGDLYYGPDRPAFGARRDCPAGTWGGACFRSGVLPITFMFTDTGQHNGPLNYIPVGYKPGLTVNSTPTSAGAPYITNNLTLGQPDITRWGTPHTGGWRAQHVGQTGETQYTALPISATPLDNQRLTFTGSTIGMNSDLTPGQMGGCGFPAAPDAFFAFTLPATTTVRVGLVSTAYDSDGDSVTQPGNFNKVLSLFSPPAIIVTPITMGTTNISPINGLTPTNYTGDTTTSLVTPAYLGNVSQCGAHGINAGGTATNERRITFTPTANMTLVGDISGSGAQAVIDLYRGVPPANPTVTASGDTNDEYLSSLNINVDTGATTDSPGYVSYTGNTAAGTLPTAVPSSDLGCGFTATTGDAVYGFHLDNPSTVTIDTEGSLIDTVLSLHTFATLPTQTIAVNNATADTGANGFAMGSANNFRTTLNGSTAGGTSNYLGVSGASCLGADTSPDHLIEFTLATAAKIRVPNTTHPAVAIYSLIKPTSAYGATDDTAFGTTGATGATAYDLNLPAVGGIASRLITLNGLGTAAGPNALSTTGKTGNYPISQFTGCPVLPSADANDDVVYKFNSPVAITGATFRIEGEGATRPMMALFSMPLDGTAVGTNGVHADCNGAVPCNVTLAANTGIRFTGDTTGMGADYSERGLAASGTSCGMTAGALDAIYRVTVPAPTALPVTFNARSTSGLDPILRLFPEQSAGVSATPWVNATLAATDGVAGGFVAVTGKAARYPASGNADLDSFAGASASTTGCVTIATSRDVFLPISLATATTVRIHAHADNDSTISVAVYPAAGPFNVAPTTTATSIACVAVGNDPTVESTLNAGNYYVVVKANRTNPSPCGGFLQPSCDNRYQDDTFYVEITDASTGASSTVPQAQLQCDDNGGGGTTAQLTRTLNPGTYDLMLTGKATAGTYNLTMTTGTASTAPTACSTGTAATGITTVGVTAATADSVATANTAPINVTNVWAGRTGNLKDGGFADNTNLGCVSNNASRDAFFRLDVTRTSHLVLTADASSNTDLAMTIVNSDGVTVATQTAPGVGAVTCNQGSGVQTLDVYLATGTYYAVMKANRAGDSACSVCICLCDATNYYQDDDFTFTVRDITEQSVHQITTNIVANTDYYLVAKGLNATAGNYKLTIGASVPPTMCVAANAQGTTSSPLPAGTHYALIKDGGGTVTASQTVSEGATATVTCPGASTIVGYTSRYGTPGVGTCAVDCGACTIGATSCSVTFDNATCGDCSSGFVKPGTLTLSCLSGGGAGPYSLDIIDQTAAEAFGMIECNDNAGLNVDMNVGATGPGFAGNASRIDRALAAGDYKVVVKGRTGADSGAYRLNVRDNTAVPDNSVTCASDSGTPTFSAALTGGQMYTAVIKGQNNINPTFSAILSDPAAALVGTCYTPGTAVSLPAGNHAIGLKGNAAGVSGAGAYQLTVEAGSAIPTYGTTTRVFAEKEWPTARGAVTATGMKVVPMQSCEPLTDWGTGLGSTSGTGPAGSGGFNACGGYFSGPGAWLLYFFSFLAIIPFIGCLIFWIIALFFIIFGLVTVNNPGVTVANNPASCDVADADALYASVQSPSGTTPLRGAWPQSKQIASDTNTVKADGVTPIAYWLRANPSSDTISYDITEALYRVTEDLRMDVSLVMQWDSSTIPGYGRTITAITPTDCVSAAGAVHRDCGNGDRPAFQVQFSNPPLTPVGQNPDPGWFGAWPGRLVIMGQPATSNSQFVLDEIPVLLIPPFMLVGPPVVTPSYAGPASYYQDIGTRECDGTTQPDWTDLFFNAEMPPGTSIAFTACAGDTPADLATCTMVPVTTVTATNVVCSDDSECRGVNGYCGSGGPLAPGGFCQVLSPVKHKGLCGSEAECPDGVANGITAGNLLSDCTSGECEYDSQPADVGTALGSLNFRRWSRMRMELRPNMAGTFAPNLLDWAVTYVCTPNQ